MKIVNIEDYFHPDAGYQVNILSKYLASFGHEVVIVAAEMDKMPKNLTSFFGTANIKERDLEFFKKYNVKIIRFPLIGYYSGRAIYKYGFNKFIHSLNPDIVYSHGNDTLVSMLEILLYKRNRYDLILDSHMLEMASKNKLRNIYYRIYRKILTPIIIKNSLTIIRTQHSDYVNKKFGIPLTQCPVITFGSDLILFKKNKNNKTDFRLKNDINVNDKIFIYAGKLDESKGGLFLANSIREKISSEKDPVFIIIGNYVGDYGSKVKEVLLQSENRVILLPAQKYIDLAYYYQIADFAMFPKQCSLSFYDVQAVGLPVICEKNEINNDRLEHGNGYIFDSNNISSFRRNIINALEMSNAEYETMSSLSESYICNNFNYYDKAREYENAIVNSITNRFEGK